MLFSQPFQHSSCMLMCVRRGERVCVELEQSHDFGSPPV